jgi:hypothetical protein
MRIGKVNPLANFEIEDVSFDELIEIRTEMNNTSSIVLTLPSRRMLMAIDSCERNECTEMESSRIELSM